MVVGLLCQDMILRFAFFRDWIDGGIPIAYWISSFYFPQAMVEVKEAASK